MANKEFQTNCLHAPSVYLTIPPIHVVQEQVLTHRTRLGQTLKELSMFCNCGWAHVNFMKHTLIN